MALFKEGDRVVLRREAGPIGGTVIRVFHEPNPTGVFPSMVWKLYVIFDDGSEITAGSGNFWLETEFDPHIPF